MSTIYGGASIRIFRVYNRWHLWLDLLIENFESVNRRNRWYQISIFLLFQWCFNINIPHRCSFIWCVFGWLSISWDSNKCQKGAVLYNKYNLNIFAEQWDFCFIVFLGQEGRFQSFDLNGNRSIATVYQLDSVIVFSPLVSSSLCGSLMKNCEVPRGIKQGKTETKWKKK